MLLIEVGKTMNSLISEPHEMYRFLATPRVEIVNFSASDSVVCAKWRYITEEQVPSLRHTNEVIAAFVACRGRMHLYTRLDKLVEGVMHCDNDSVIFIQKDGEPSLVQCGDALGDISVTKENEYISEFLSGGPKNYSYKLSDSVTGK